MISTPQLMTIDSNLLTVIESLQNALQVGSKATDVVDAVDADGAPLLDPLTGDQKASYAYAYGWNRSTIENTITNLQLIRDMLTVE